MKVLMATFAVSATLLAGGVALGQNENRDQKQPTRVTEIDSSVSKDQMRKAFNTCRSSKLIGKSVQNAEGKDLGEIHEIVIDPTSGRIAYGVLSFGGWMGLGDKLFAVPWQSFKSGAEEKLVLNVNKQALENAKGFDADHYPDMADQRWATETHRTFAAKPYWEDKGSAERDRRDLRVVRVSELDGKTLLNNRSESLGTIKDLLIDHGNGRLVAATLARGGVMGVGADEFIVPWAKINVLPDGKDDCKLVTDISEEQFSAAPKMVAEGEYERKPTYFVTVYRHYHVDPYWAVVEKSKPE